MFFCFIKKIAFNLSITTHLTTSNFITLFSHLKDGCRVICKLCETIFPNYKFDVH